MKKISIKNFVSHSRWALYGLLCSVCAVHVACSDDDEAVQGVDLRYRVENEYNLPASNAEPIVFQVKSTDLWKVYSLHEKEQWCSISPSSGEAGEIADVEVKYADNTELDDRVDTLVIQSNYWIGKWVTVNQKGTAFLRCDAPTDELDPAEWIGKVEGSLKTYQIESNQNWSVAITEGSEWLSLEGEAAGSLNGSFTVKAALNEGAVRTAKISIYDRHQQLQKVVLCTQDGILLKTDTPELKMPFGAKADYKISFKSNAKWTIEKENPDDAWFTLSETAFENDGEVVIAVQENDTRRARSATLIARTKATADGVYVEQKVVLKQIYKPYPIRWEFSKEMFPEDSKGQIGWIYQGLNGSPKAEMKNTDMYCTGNTRIVRYNRPVGIYTLKVKPLASDAKTGFWFTVGSGSGKVEFRYFLNAANMAVEISASKNVKPKVKIKNFDPTIENIIEIKVEKGSGSSAKVTYYLNGKQAAQCTDKIVKNWNAPMTLYIGSQKGNVVYDYMEYTELVTISNLE